MYLSSFRSPSPNAVSMSPSMATTFEPELQSIMTDKDTEEMISRDSKFRERYSTQIPKSSSDDTTNDNHPPVPIHPHHPHMHKNLRFWKSCLSPEETKHLQTHQNQPKSVLKSHLQDHSGSTDAATKMNTLKKNKSKAMVEEKFAETQEYLRKPNVLYPPWTTSTSAAPPPPTSPPTEHYHTLPTNLHAHHVHHSPHTVHSHQHHK